MCYYPDCLKAGCPNIPSLCHHKTDDTTYRDKQKYFRDMDADKGFVSRRQFILMNGAED